MKNKFKKAFISGAIMATGLTVGYAASTAFDDLKAIEYNFNYILNQNKDKQDEINDLNTTITELNTQNKNKQNDIDGLNDTIEDLKADIAELKQTQNNSGKQPRIKELEDQVTGLIAERDRLETEHGELKDTHDALVTERDGLITELNGLEKENLELETAIKDLRVYTDGFVNEDVEED